MASQSAGLAENKCLRRHPNGARLLQIGEQQIALGAKFRAKVILDIRVSINHSTIRTEENEHWKAV